MPKSKRYFLPEYIFFPVLFSFAALQLDNTNLHFYKYAKFNKMHQREHKLQTDISRRLAVPLLTNIFNKKYLQSKDCVAYLFFSLLHRGNLRLH